MNLSPSHIPPLDTQTIILISRILSQNIEKLKAELEEKPDFKIQILRAIEHPLPTFSNDYKRLRGKISLLVDKSEMPVWLNPFLMLDENKSLSPIFQLIKDNDFENLKEFKNSVIETIRDSQGRTPLQHAIEYGASDEMVSALLRLHPNWSVVKHDGCYPFHNTSLQKVEVYLEVLFPNSYYDRLAYIATQNNKDLFFEYGCSIAEHLLPADEIIDGWESLHAAIFPAYTNTCRESVVPLILFFETQWSNKFPVSLFLAYSCFELFEENFHSLPLYPHPYTVPKKILEVSGVYDWSYIDGAPINAILYRSFYLDPQRPLVKAELEKLKGNLRVAVMQYYLPEHPESASLNYTDIDREYSLDRLLELKNTHLAGFFASGAFSEDWLLAKALYYARRITQDKNNPPNIIKDILIFGPERALKFYKALTKEISGMGHGPLALVTILTHHNPNQNHDVFIELVKKMVKKPGVDDLESFTRRMEGLMLDLFLQGTPLAAKIAACVAKKCPLYKIKSFQASTQFLSFKYLYILEHQKDFVATTSSNLTPRIKAWFEAFLALGFVLDTSTAQDLICTTNDSNLLRKLIPICLQASVSVKDRMKLFSKYKETAVSSTFHLEAWKVFFETHPFTPENRNEEIIDCLIKYIEDNTDFDNVKTYAKAVGMEDTLWQKTGNYFLKQLINAIDFKRTKRTKDVFISLINKCDSTLLGMLNLECSDTNLTLFLDSHELRETGWFIFQRSIKKVSLHAPTRSPLFNESYSKFFKEKLHGSNKDTLQYISSSKSLSAKEEGGLISLFYKGSCFFKGYATHAEAKLMLKEKRLSALWNYLSEKIKATEYYSEYPSFEWFINNKKPLCIGTDDSTKTIQFYTLDDNGLGLRNFSVIEISTLQKLNEEIKTFLEIKKHVYEEYLSNSPEENLDTLPSTECLHTFTEFGARMVARGRYYDLIQEVYYGDLETITPILDGVKQSIDQEKELRKLLTPHRYVVAPRPLLPFYERMKYLIVAIDRTEDIEGAAVNSFNGAILMTKSNSLIVYADTKSTTEIADKLFHFSRLIGSCELNKTKVNTVIAKNKLSFPVTAAAVDIDLLPALLGKFLLDSDFVEETTSTALEASSNFAHFFAVLKGARVVTGWPNREEYKAEYDKLLNLTSHILERALKDKDDSLLRPFALDVANFGSFCGTKLHEITEQNWTLLNVPFDNDTSFSTNFLENIYRSAFYDFIKHCHSSFVSSDSEAAKQSIHLENFIKHHLYLNNWAIPDNPLSSNGDFSKDIYAEGTGRTEYTEEIVPILFERMMPFLLMSKIDEYQVGLIQQNRTTELGDLFTYFNNLVESELVNNPELGENYRTELEKLEKLITDKPAAAAHLSVNSEVQSLKEAKNELELTIRDKAREVNEFELQLASLRRKILQAERNLKNEEGIIPLTRFFSLTDPEEYQENCEEQIGLTLVIEQEKGELGQLRNNLAILESLLNEKETAPLEVNPVIQRDPIGDQRAVINTLKENFCFDQGYLTSDRIIDGIPGLPLLTPKAFFKLLSFTGLLAEKVAAATPMEE